MSRYKRLYDELTKNNELLEMFPTLTGVWIDDKIKFIREQDQLELAAIIEPIDLEIEDNNLW